MAVAADTNSVRRSRTKSPAVAVIVAVVTNYSALAMGWGIEDRGTIARRVEHATGPHVLNAAVPGYSLRQSLSLLTHLDRSHQRDLVIAYFLPQDTSTIRQPLRQGQPAAEDRLPREVHDDAVAQCVAKRRPLIFGLKRVLDNHLNARTHALFARKVSEIILRDLGGRPSARQIIKSTAAASEPAPGPDRRRLMM